MIKVLHPGFYSTLQDNGRFHYREYGIPVSGVMDSYSSQFANMLLGNAKDATVIEMTMLGGTFQFMEPTVISIAGAHMNPRLNDQPIDQNIIIPINRNDILSLGRVNAGFRTYLAIKDGFTTDIVLGSRSQYKPITRLNCLALDDGIPYNSIESDLVQNKNVTVKFDGSILKRNIIEVFKGPEYCLLSKEQSEHLLSKEWKISKNNNRMAYQLEPLLENNLKSMLTSPVLPGTVQLTPKGNLIVLMKDCQTTGGYPRILQLTEDSINVLSQKHSGNSLKIRLRD